MYQLPTVTKSKMILFEPANETDIGALGTLSHLCFHRAFKDIMTATSLSLRPVQYFIDRFTQRWHDVVKVVSCERIIGFAMTNGGHIDMFFIHPDFQGTGIGTDLLDYLVSKCAINTLECFQDNVKARRFYERKGWIQSNAFTREYCGEPYDFVSYKYPTI